MPLHEYHCDACGHQFEAIQKFSDPPLEKCPKCGGVLRKLQAAPAIQFKGSGWYITDYAKKNSPAKSESGSAESASKDKAETTKTEKAEKAEKSSTSSDSTTSSSKDSSAKDS